MNRTYEHLDALSKFLDHKDSAGVLEFLTEDCVFRAGNAQPIKGKAEIKATLEAFFKAIKTTKHHIEEVFEAQNKVVHRGQVTYTRFDNTQLQVPFCDVFTMKGMQIEAYDIYIDWSELFTE